MNNKSKKNIITQKLLPAILAGSTAGLTFFFFGVIDIFAGNRDEFLFSFGDFGVQIALVALCAAVLLAAVIFFLPGKFSDVAFGVVVWITAMGYIQALFLNGAGTLRGDDGTQVNVSFAIIDGLIWIITGAGCIFGAIKMEKKKFIKSAFVILLVMILVMQLAGCATEIKDITTDTFSTRENTETTTTSYSETTITTDQTETTTDIGKLPVDSPDVKKAYLTSQGLTEVSNGKNVIIFLIDRFDVSYYQDAIKKTPDFFNGLRGFTYFNDNISLYSRTFPGVPSMITGVEDDFSSDMNGYFNKAYGTSAFLHDLKANDYKIKLYIQNYYCYRDGTPFYGMADNFSVATDYKITDRGALVGNMLALSAYRYLPTALKGAVNISSASFYGIVDYNGEAPMYELDDCGVYEAIKENGLSFDESENSYIFIHLSGCHDPFTMASDGSRTEKGSPEESLYGCFNMIYDYIEELKRLGVYDDSTIIITGDHPRARDDAEIPSQPRQTALFVKISGAPDEPLKYSSAQVSQANLIPTIIKSAGIKTENDYGKTYYEISEGENNVRYHKFELYVKGESDRIVTFEVTGPGDDFSNWNIKSQDEIDYVYK